MLCMGGRGSLACNHCPTARLGMIRYHLPFIPPTCTAFITQLEICFFGVVCVKVLAIAGKGFMIFRLKFWMRRGEDRKGEWGTKIGRDLKKIIGYGIGVVVEWEGGD